MNCGHAWHISPEQHMALMRMTPVCPECGAMDVSESFLPPPPGGFASRREGGNE